MVRACVSLHRSFYCGAISSSVCSCFPPLSQFVLGPPFAAHTPSTTCIVVRWLRCPLLPPLCPAHSNSNGACTAHVISAHPPLYIAALRLPPPRPPAAPPPSTAYITTHGDLERNTGRIARRYLRGAFVLELLAALPLVALLRAVGVGRGAAGGGQLTWLGLLKLLRLVTVAR